MHLKCCRNFLKKALVVVWKIRVYWIKQPQLLFSASHLFLMNERWNLCFFCFSSSSWRELSIGLFWWHLEGQLVTLFSRPVSLWFLKCPLLRPNAAEFKRLVVYFLTVNTFPVWVGILYLDQFKQGELWYLRGLSLGSKVVSWSLGKGQCWGGSFAPEWRDGGTSS